MARNTTTIEQVWGAKGNLPNNAIVATADGKYPALDGSLITGIAGAGDMNASVYDPTTIQADAFARANHTGTQTAATITDFDTEVANNSAVTANTAKVPNASTIGTADETTFLRGDNAWATPAGDSLGVINYPYTTDFISGVGQTRNLTSITNSDGYTNNSNLTSIYVGSNVTSIGSAAFIFCTGLTSITIPNSVTSIGSNAFADCTSLTSVTIGNSVTSIGDGAFNSCSSLTSVIIPNSVTSIGQSAFYQCSGLTSATIGNSVTSIGNYAFSNCTGLTSVTIPDSVTSIGISAFYFCTGLATINCLATTAPTIGSDAFLAVAASDIHVPVGATGYGTTYGGLTVFADL